MEQIILIGVWVVTVCMITWWTGRSIDAMRRRDHVAHRLVLDKPDYRTPVFR